MIQIYKQAMLKSFDSNGTLALEDAKKLRTRNSTDLTQKVSLNWAKHNQNSCLFLNDIVIIFSGLPAEMPERKYKELTLKSFMSRSLFFLIGSLLIGSLAGFTAMQHNQKIPKRYGTPGSHSTDHQCLK